MLLNLLNFCKKKEGEHNICSNDRNSMFKSRKSLGYHATWLHNECCCVRFSKSDVRPSAGFSARNHIGRRETRLSDKGSECVRYLDPVCPCTKTHLLHKNVSPLHTNSCAGHINGSRGSEQKIVHFVQNLAMYTLASCAVH